MTEKNTEGQGADYKNWVPKRLLAAIFCCFLAALGVAGITGRMSQGGWRTALLWIFVLLSVFFMALFIWMSCLYRAFDYKGSRRMSAQIIDGIAARVEIPEGGRGLDIGCGSGALAIACAKRNPAAEILGVDRWGVDYGSFSKGLCERNAAAEGTGNVTFRQGDACRLNFPDESFDAVFSNYVYHNIPVRDRQAILLETLRVLKKGGSFAIHDIFSRAKYGDMDAFVRKLRDMGYAEVRLVDTTDGTFMSRREAAWLGLSGSAMLLGRK